MCDINKVDKCITEPNSVNVEKDCCDKYRNCELYNSDGIKKHICVLYFDSSLSLIKVLSNRHL